MKTGINCPKCHLSLPVGAGCVYCEPAPRVTARIQWGCGYRLGDIPEGATRFHDHHIAWWHGDDPEPEEVISAYWSEEGCYIVAP
jgi:hypothetical protein